MLKKFLKKLSSEQGGLSTIYLGIALIVFCCVIGGFVVDYAKNVYILKSYTRMAQNAVQRAVSSQNATGGLSPDCMRVAVTEYLAQRNGSNGDRVETKTFRSFSDNPSAYPKFTFKFYKKRGIEDTAVSYTSINSPPLVNDNLLSSDGYGYSVIEMKVDDIVDNYFWALFGFKSTKLNIIVSSVGTSKYDKELIYNTGLQQ